MVNVEWGRWVLLFKNKYLKQHANWNPIDKTEILKIFITDLSQPMLTAEKMTIVRCG